MTLLLCVLTLALVALIVAAVLARRMRPEQDVQIIFAKTYLKTYRSTGDRKESLLTALSLVRKRPPFSEVSEEEAAFLADLFGRLHQPHLVLGQVLHMADHKHSAGYLRNRAHLQTVIEGARAQGA